MGENSNIEWTDHTFNPWIGCTAISPACAHCYAKVLVERWGGDFDARRRTSPSNWQRPRRWHRKAKAMGFRQRVFCASLADVWDNQVPIEWLVDLLDLIRTTESLDWLLLSKRPQNILKRLAGALIETSGALADWIRAWLAGTAPANVWLGITVENQEEADRRIPRLLGTPAQVRFLSCEPLLGPLDMMRWLPKCRPAVRPGGEPFMAPHFFMTRCEHCNWIGSSELLLEVHYDDDADILCPQCERSICGDEIGAIDWVISGGESGPGARPSHPDWARALRDQCAAAGVPFLFKQHGEWIGAPDLRSLPGGSGPGFGAYDRCAYDMDADAVRVGKKAAGRLLDGVLHDALPQVRP